MASFKSLLLILSLLYILNAQDEHPTCGFDHSYEPDIVDIDEDTTVLEGRRLQTYPNMRIYSNYDRLEATASASYNAYIKNELVPPVIAFLQAALRVKTPVIGKLKLGSSVRTLCGKSVPSILKSEGVDADFVVLFDSKSESGTNVANSGYCTLASGSKRPFISQTTFNRPQLLEAKGDILLHEKNTYLLIHEIQHSLGIADGAFPNFIDETGKRRTGHIKKMSVAGKTSTVLDVPILTERLRNFYGCPTLPGLVLENDGGSGSAGSHFERKLFPFEAMSSGGVNGRRVSEFSLAVLEASGWYDPDYSFAEPYDFGRGQGCGFVNNKCSTTPAFQEFCSGSNRGCAPQGRAGGKCNSDAKADGCKWIVPSVDYDCENDDGEDYARLPELQAFGRDAGSKCFTGDLNTRKSTSSSSRTTWCFKYTCSGEGTSTQLEIKVGANNILCTQAGKKTIDGYYGSIDCPDPLAFCNTVGKRFCPRNCMGRGTCVDNKCQCNPGFKGIDCGLNV